MADKDTVIVGCDINTSQDSAFQNAVCEKLESAGYTVEKLPIAPNPFASYSYSSSAQGKIGVYIIAPATFSIADYHYGANKNKQSFKMAVFGIRADFNNKMKGSNWDNVPIGRDADYSGLPTDIVGKTFKEMNEMLKEDTRIVKGETPEEMAENVLKAIGGKVDDDKEGSSASSIKDAIKEVMSFWDGEVECYVRDDTMYIHKIKPPEEECNLLLAEGLNIASDSLSITDYNPDTINFLTVHWPGGEDIIYRDEALIARFGEKPLELDAVKRIVTTETTSTSSSTDTSETDTETSTDTTSSSDTSSTTEEVPVETYEEALAFANVEWSKIKRDDGHTVECKTAGSEYFQVGQWCKVYAPSWNLDQYMYITRASQNETDGGWECSLSLTDYPPSLGEYQEPSTDEEEDMEDMDLSEDVSLDVEAEDVE